MIHWIDEFMRLFGYARPEVWEAEGREHDVTFPAPQALKEPRKRSNVRSKKANVRSKLLTLSELRKDSGKCHAIYQMVDAFTDEQIAKEIGATVRAVEDYRLLVGWRRR